MSILFGTDAIAYGSTEHYNLYSPTSFYSINSLLAYSLKGFEVNSSYKRALGSYSFINNSITEIKSLAFSLLVASL